MASLSEHHSRPAVDRRHSSDHYGNNLPTPPSSRPGSAASNTSHRSEPAWMSTFNGIDTSRNSSIVSTSTMDSNKTKQPSGFKSLFSSKPKDPAAKAAKKEQKKKDTDKIVLTSRHAAAVKTKIALDPKLKVKTAGVVGNQHSSHSTAAQHEMRHPHSGPPALHAQAGKVEMPVLTRIASGDERDDEDEVEMARRREEWIMAKMPDLNMSKVMEHEASSEEESIAEGEVIDVKVFEVGGARLVGAEIRPEAHRARSHGNRPMGVGWRRDEKGHWKR